MLSKDGKKKRIRTYSSSSSSVVDAAAAIDVHHFEASRGECIGQWISNDKNLLNCATSILCELRKIFPCKDSVSGFEKVLQLLKKYCLNCGLAFPIAAQNLLFRSNAAQFLGVDIFWLLHVNRIFLFDDWLISCSFNSTDDMDACKLTAQFIRRYAFVNTGTVDSLPTLLCADIVSHMHMLCSSGYGTGRDCAVRVLRLTSFGFKSTSRTIVIEGGDLTFLTALLGPTNTFLGGAGLNWQVGMVEMFLACTINSSTEQTRLKSQIGDFLTSLPPNLLLLAFERILRTLPQPSEKDDQQKYLERKAKGGLESEKEMGEKCALINPVDDIAANHALIFFGSQSVLFLVVLAMFDLNSARAGVHNRYFEASSVNSLLTLSLQVINSSLESGNSSHCIQRALILVDTVCTLGIDAERGDHFRSKTMTTKCSTSESTSLLFEQWDTRSVWFGDLLRINLPKQYDNVEIAPFSLQQFKYLCSAIIDSVPRLRKNSVESLFAVLRSCRIENSTLTHQTGQNMFLCSVEGDVLLRTLRERVLLAARQLDPMFSIYGQTELVAEVAISVHSRASSGAPANPSDKKHELAQVTEALRCRIPAWVRSLDAVGSLPVGVGAYVNSLGGQALGGRKLLRSLRALAEEGGHVTSEVAFKLASALVSHVPPLITSQDADMFQASNKMSTDSNQGVTLMLLSALDLNKHSSLCRELLAAGAVIEQALVEVQNGQMLGAFDSDFVPNTNIRSCVAVDKTKMAAFWSSAVDDLIQAWYQHANTALLAASRAPSVGTSTQKYLLYKTCTLLATLLRQLICDISMRLARCSDVPIRHLPSNDSANSKWTTDTDERQFVAHYMCLVRHLFRAIDTSYNQTLLRCLVCCLTTNGPGSDDPSAQIEVAMTYSAGMALACLDFPACTFFLTQFRCKILFGEASAADVFSKLRTARVVHAAVYWFLEEGVGFTPSQAIHAYSDIPDMQLSSYIYVRAVHTWLLTQLNQLQIHDPVLRCALRMDKAPFSHSNITRAQELGMYISSEKALQGWIQKPIGVGDSETISSAEMHYQGWVAAMSSDGPYASFVLFVDADRNRNSDSPDVSSTFLEIAEFVTMQEIYRLLIYTSGPKKIAQDLEQARPPFVSTFLLSAMSQLREDYEDQGVLRGQNDNNIGKNSSVDAKFLPLVWPAVLNLTMKSVMKCPDGVLTAPLHEACAESLRVSLMLDIDRDIMLDACVSGSWADEDCPVLMSTRAKDIVSCALLVLTAGPALSERGSSIDSLLAEYVLPKALTDFSTTRDPYQAQVTLLILMGVIRALYSSTIVSKTHSSIVHVMSGCSDMIDMKILIELNDKGMGGYLKWALTLRPAISYALGYFRVGHLADAAEICIHIKSSLNLSDQTLLIRNRNAFDRLESMRMTFQENFFHFSSGKSSAQLFFLVRIAHYVFLNSLQDEAGMYAVDVSARSALFLGMVNDVCATFSYVKVCEICLDLGWSILTFIVAINATLEESMNVLEFFLPRKLSTPPSVDNGNLFSLLHHCCQSSMTKDKHVSDEEVEKVRFTILHMCVQTLCASLIHSDRHFGLYSNPFRAEASPSINTERKLSISCIQYVIPVIASYSPNDGTKTDFTRNSVKEYVTQKKMDFPEIVQKDCLGRLDDYLI